MAEDQPSSEPRQDQLFIHFLPGKEAQIEGKPWIIHSRKGCFKVGRVEFETVLGMTTGEKAPEIGSKEAVCNCGVSNHHLAMWGVVKVTKKKIPKCGDRSVGIIRRLDDDVVETEVNVQLFRERISTLQKEVAEKHKDAKQAHGRAQRLDAQLSKSQEKLSAANKEINESEGKINNLDLQLQQMQQSAQSRNRDLDNLSETVKMLRSSTAGGFQKTRNPQKSEVQYLSDSLSKYKRKCEELKGDLKRQQTQHKERLSAFEGRLEGSMRHVGNMELIDLEAEELGALNGVIIEGMPTPPPPFTDCTPTASVQETPDAPPSGPLDQDAPPSGPLDHDGILQISSNSLGRTRQTSISKVTDSTLPPILSSPPGSNSSVDIVSIAKEFVQGSHPSSSPNDSVMQSGLPSGFDQSNTDITFEIQTHSMIRKADPRQLHQSSTALSTSSSDRSSYSQSTDRSSHHSNNNNNNPSLMCLAKPVVPWLRLHVASTVASSTVSSVAVPSTSGSLDRSEGQQNTSPEEWKLPSADAAPSGRATGLVLSSTTEVRGTFDFSNSQKNRYFQTVAEYGEKMKRQNCGHYASCAAEYETEDTAREMKKQIFRSLEYRTVSVAPHPMVAFASNLPASTPGGMTGGMKPPSNHIGSAVQSHMFVQSEPKKVLEVRRASVSLQASLNLQAKLDAQRAAMCGHFTSVRDHQGRWLTHVNSVNKSLPLLGGSGLTGTKCSTVTVPAAYRANPNPFKQPIKHHSKTSATFSY